MASRFHIEELLSQDASGVVYRAIDQASAGATVAIRRVLPLGADGPGLGNDEQAVYRNAIEQVTDFRHPALRTIVTGDCDPIDAMPFIVTEWVEGEPLSKRLETGPLPQRSAVEIINRAIDVCEVLSEKFGEQAVWVNTEPSSLIQTAGGLTFAVSPLKLCAASTERRSLKALGHLAEDLMGWRNRLVSEQSGGPLVTWLKWVKQHSKTATLAELRANLPGATPAAPTAPVVPTARVGNRQTARPAAPSAAAVSQPAAVASRTKQAPAKKASKAPLLSLISLVVVLAAAGFLLTKGKPLIAKFLPNKAASTAVVTDASVLSESTAPTVDPAILKKIPEGPFLPNDSSVILQMKGEYVMLRGILQQVRYSDSGKTLYLEFEKTPPLTNACGFIRKAAAPADMTPAALAPMIGKRVRIRGVVFIEELDDQQRPQVLIADRKAIQVDP